MKAPAWWRRWFGGKPASPTGPASPLSALDQYYLEGNGEHPVSYAELSPLGKQRAILMALVPEATASHMHGFRWRSGAWSTVLGDSATFLATLVQTYMDPHIDDVDGRLYYLDAHICYLLAVTPDLSGVIATVYTQFPPDVEPYKPEPGAIIPPFDFIADTAAEWNSVPQAPDALEVHVLPPEFSVVTINREELAQKRAERHAHAIRTFNLEFARLVRVEADGNYSRMARRLGVAPSVVGRWASGKLSPSIHNFLKFCVEYEFVLGDFTGTDEFE